MKRRVLKQFGPRNAVAFFALTLGILAELPDATAQTSGQARAYCNSTNNQYAPELRVRGCTAIIQSGRADQTNTVIALSNRGLAYFDQRDYSRAIADYDQAIRLNPQYAAAFNNRGLAYRAQNNYARAIADFDQAIRLNPQLAEAFNNRGNAYIAQSDYARGIADYDQAIGLNPQYATAFNNRASAYYGQRDYARAIADYDQAIRLNPQSAKALNNRGLAYRAQRDYARAIADFDQAIRLNPQYAEAFNNRGLAFRAQSDHARAFADFDRAAELEPQAGARQNERCWARAVAGQQLDIARAACNRAIALAGDDAERGGFLDSRGLVGLKQQRWQEAWNDYDAALRAAPDAAHYLYGRGIAALRLGRRAEGQADLSRAAAVDANVAAAYTGYGITL